MSQIEPIVVDEKGRGVVEAMSDRQLLVEIVERLRNFEDVAEQFIEAAQSNPMLRMMLPR